MIVLKRTYSDEPGPDGGQVNDAPPNLRDITEKEFAQSAFFSYTPDLMEFRQVQLDKPNGPQTSIKIFWMEDGECFVFANDFWPGKVRIMRGCICEHEYRELDEKEAREQGHYHAGRCWHVNKCLNCGRVESYDSSD